MTIGDIVRRIDLRVKAARADMALLTAARQELVQEDETAHRVGRRTGEPGPEATWTEQVDRILRNADGISTAAVAEEIGSDPNRVLAALKHMEAAGRVRRSGKGRATRWHLADQAT